MTISVFSKDLLDQSKIRNKLSADNVQFFSSVDSLAAQDSDAFLVDLKDSEALTALEKLNGKLSIGFGSHVDIDRMNAASSAGCTLTVPRSRFFARMSEVIQEARNIYSAQK